MLPPPRLILSQQVVEVRGRRLALRVYRCEHRFGARRIVALDGDAIVFDSGDCMDISNASAALHRWQAAQAMEQSA